MKVIPQRLADRQWFSRWQHRNEFRRRIATIGARTIVGASGSSYIARQNNASIGLLSSGKGEFGPGERVFIDSSKDRTVDMIQGTVPPEETTTQTEQGQTEDATNVPSLL